MNIVDSLKYIDEWLLDNGSDAFDLPEPARQDDIARLESLIKQRVPKDLVAIYQRHDGYSQWIQFCETWELLPIRYVVKYYSQNLDVFDDIVADEPWEKSWLPILADGAGDYIYLDLKTDKLSYYHHEGGYSDPMLLSLADYLSKVADEMKKGKYKVEDEELIYTE